VDKKKGINAFQRLMNVLTIVGVVITITSIEIYMATSPNNKEVWSFYLITLALWGLIIVAPNYIIFKTVTIWHSDK